MIYKRKKVIVYVVIFFSCFFLILTYLNRQKDEFRSVEDLDRLEFSSKKRHVKIGIIDGDIQSSHSAFQKIYSIEKKYFVTQINEIDINHGTSVLGILGGDIGIANSEYLNVVNAVVLSNGTCSAENLKKAIKWCISQKVEIINVSISFNRFSPDVLDEISKDNSKDVLFIFSNGNFETRKRIIKKSENMIFVGSADSNGNKSDINSISEADVYFQGVDILTSVGMNELNKVKGTTYATALATGLATKKLQSTEKRTVNQVGELKEFLFSMGLKYK